LNERNKIIETNDIDSGDLNENHFSVDSVDLNERNKIIETNDIDTVDVNEKHCSIDLNDNHVDNITRNLISPRYSYSLNIFFLTKYFYHNN